MKHLNESFWCFLSFIKCPESFEVFEWLELLVKGFFPIVVACLSIGSSGMCRILSKLHAKFELRALMTLGCQNACFHQCNLIVIAVFSPHKVRMASEIACLLNSNDIVNVGFGPCKIRMCFKFASFGMINQHLWILKLRGFCIGPWNLPCLPNEPWL